MTYVHSLPCTNSGDCGIAVEQSAVGRKAFRRVHITFTERLKLENVYIFLLLCDVSCISTQYCALPITTQYQEYAPKSGAHDGFCITCLTLMMLFGGK